MRNKFINIVNVVGVLLVLMTITISCEDYDYPTPPQATVATLPADLVTGNSAVFTGILTSDNGDPVSTKGFCWDTEPNPTLSSKFVVINEDTDTFSYNNEALEGGTVYYYRAYATNNGGIAFGENMEFETLPVPKLKTLDVTEVTGTTAKSGGKILDLRGSTITERGICWSTEENPTINDNKAVDNSGSDSYRLEMTGLEAGTVYHVRAYAITQQGLLAYGEDINFSTLIVDYDGNIYTAVTIGEQTWMVENYKCTTDANGDLIAGAKWNNKDTAHEYGLAYRQIDIVQPGFAPQGWHVPSKEEIETLVNYVGQDNLLTLKELGTDHWNTDNGTNETGFTALGATVWFAPLKNKASWWSSSDGNDSTKGWRWEINDAGKLWAGGPNKKTFNFPVRLIKDK